MSAPASAQAVTCATVAATSVVRVFVIVCTLIGAPPPTGTAPTWMRRDWRRSMLRHGRMGLWVMGGGPCSRHAQTISDTQRQCHASGSQESTAERRWSLRAQAWDWLLHQQLLRLSPIVRLGPIGSGGYLLAPQGVRRGDP